MMAKVLKSFRVPQDVSEGMSGRPDVNWSTVATEAFQRRLALLEREDGIMSTVDRLRESKAASATRDRTHGREAGRSWARGTAEFVDLKHLAEFRDGLSLYEWEDWFEDDTTAYSVGEHLFFVLSPDDFGCRPGSEKFWNGAVGPLDSSRDLLASGEFVCGFAEGALEIYDEVIDQL